MRNRLKGITLIETVVYLAIFSVVIIMILNFMLSTQESTLRTERKALLSKNIHFITMHLEDSFDNVREVGSTNSIFDNNFGRLELILGSGAKQYTIIDNRLYFDSVPISSREVNVTAFNLQPVYQGSSEITGINVNIQLRAKGDDSLIENINMLFTVR